MLEDDLKEMERPPRLWPWFVAGLLIVGSILGYESLRKRNPAADTRPGGDPGIVGVNGKSGKGAGAAAQPERLAVDLGGRARMEMIRIKPGTFAMGSPREEVGRNPGEKAFDAESLHDVAVADPGQRAEAQEQQLDP